MQFCILPDVQTVAKVHKDIHIDSKDGKSESIPGARFIVCMKHNYNVLFHHFNLVVSSVYTYSLNTS